MYYLASISLEGVEEKHQKLLEEEFELFRYHNSEVAKTLIEASNESIKLTLCGLEGEDEAQVVNALIINTMFSSDVSKQSLETLQEVFTTALIAHKELSRAYPEELNDNLLLMIRNHCDAHLPHLDCSKLDSLVDKVSKEPSACT